MMLMLGFTTTVQPNLRGLIANAQSLLDQIKADLNLTQGEVIMFIPDMPNVPPQDVPVMIAQANQTQANNATTVRTIGVCFTAPNQNYSGENVTAPVADVSFYLRQYEKRTATGPATVTILQQPKHGVLRLITEADRGTLFGSTAGTLNPADPGYAYLPEPGYVGKDSATILVDFGSVKVTVKYYFHAVSGPVEEQDYCGKTGPYWKISSTLTNGNSTITSVEYQSPNIYATDTSVTNTAVLASTLDSSILGNLIGDTAGIALSIADLPNGAVGQTSSTSITLDDNAAGYNWFIDQTPGSNEEFLPTSNPNEWVAKAGSEAEGKMDMLSVLLHEYGHALGIEHSADSGDYMAATLQPGVRRLPSSDELALMAKLVGGLKTGQDNAPINPSLPIGTTLGALLLGRLRRTDYGSWSPVFDSVQLTTPTPQLEVAANPKLENMAFDNGTNWNAEGTVAFANGAATLSETAATQTRLNQVFVLGEHDRFLSFTLANTALGDQVGPDDAFEVALIDANTGHSLMGSTGLTRNDAILNLQANGSEHKASGITRIDNADGSHTYLVDLAGIAAGTTVNLAFDLIGFGLGAETGNSHLTIRDLRLGVPQIADDSATLAEDTPTVIDALANDLNARQPGFAPVVVSGPAHGQVTINADGSFSFTPEKDWVGQDTFTYKLSDGHVDSNLATVTLTVTPVNDAPVAADGMVNLAEDAPKHHRPAGPGK